MILEALIIFGLAYLILGLSIYVNSVVQTYGYMGRWIFDIDRNYIGICKYPYWTLFWLHKLRSVFKRG